MKFHIANRIIGEDSPTFIVAEMSANHNQNFDLAVRTIQAMHKAGADAVKLQTFKPEDMTFDLDSEMFMTRKGTLWEGRKLFDLYKEAAIPWEWHGELKRITEDLGMIFFSSPFSKASADFLEDLGVGMYKIASPEITDIPLIKHVSSFRKPIIISTGIAEYEDIKLAIDTCHAQGNFNIALLKCTTAYPAPLDEINLRTIPDLVQQFGVIPGLSDHTLGVAVPIAAIALGAKIIEKHFILDRDLKGLDSKFSLEPSEFALMVESIRAVEVALGEVSYELTASTQKSRSAARSLFAAIPIRKGEFFSELNVKAIRPGFGLHPKYWDIIIGQKATKDISAGTPLEWNLIETQGE